MPRGWQIVDVATPLRGLGATLTPTDKEKTFRIGEAAELLGLETYVLRFWETEFPHLAPLRTPKGQRLYAERHIEQLRRVKHLLHEQGFTIEGARRVLESEAGEVADGLPEPAPCQGFLFSPLLGSPAAQSAQEERETTRERAADDPVRGQSGGTDTPGETCQLGQTGQTGQTGATGRELDRPRLREALRQLHEELVEVRELLRSHRAKSPTGDDA